MVGKINSWIEEHGYEDGIEKAFDAVSAHGALDLSCFFRPIVKHRVLRIHKASGRVYGKKRRQDSHRVYVECIFSAQAAASHDRLVCDQSVSIQIIRRIGPLVWRTLLYSCMQYLIPRVRRSVLILKNGTCSSYVAIYYLLYFYSFSRLIFRAK